MIATVISRGHSGTRLISHTLSASGFFMGYKQNESGDMLDLRYGKPRRMYEACSTIGNFVKCTGKYTWDFSEALSMNPTDFFIKFVNEYLDQILNSNKPNKGWKLPETNLAYPWIVKMFPDIKYIYWIRDPRDCILKEHYTDNLDRFNIPHIPVEIEMDRRMISWKYQSELFKATPPPKHLIKIRYEDFVLDQDNELQRLSEFLGVEMKKILVSAEPIGRWKNQYNMFNSEIYEYGYER